MVDHKIYIKPGSEGVFSIASRIGNSVRTGIESARHEVQSLRRSYGHKPGFEVVNQGVPEPVYNQIVN